MKTTKKAFKCQLCETSFQRNYYLHLHIRTVHEGINFKCDLCNKEFAQESYLNFHVKAVHE